ncbi:MAG TPA: methyltransferase domain-containing protein [Gammaproteobacteria bacterium]
MRPAWAEPAAHPFDEVAATYDASFTQSLLGARLRSLVWERLDAALAGCGRVLEIGCGTGEDAVRLACRGVDVVATDPSPAMLRVAAAKAARAGCAQRIRFVCAPMERLADALGGERFDGAFSSFGAVNCVPDLERALAGLATLLEPRAPLLLVVMGRHAPWEWAWFLVRGRWREAFRRCRKDGALWRGLRIRYPTPAEFAAALGAQFAPIGRRPLGVLLPPTYASAWLERRPKVLGALATLERALQRWQPLAALADHYILEAVRR